MAVGGGAALSEHQGLSPSAGVSTSTETHDCVLGRGSGLTSSCRTSGGEPQRSSAGRTIMQLGCNCFPHISGNES